VGDWEKLNEAKDRDQWRVLVNTIVNFLVPLPSQKVGTSLLAG
jgi:hypothetical protein